MLDSRVYSSAVEHGIADPAVAGSIPAAPLLLPFVFDPSQLQKQSHRSVTHSLYVPVAQLDKASDYESEDWGFKSLQGYIFILRHMVRRRLGGLPSSLNHGGALAQSVECALCKREVQGSKP